MFWVSFQWNKLMFAGPDWLNGGAGGEGTAF